MKTQRRQSRQPGAKPNRRADASSHDKAGQYGSQAPKPSTRNPAGDTVVQAKPGGAKLHGDKLSQPGYLEEAAEREMPASPRRSASTPGSRSKPARAQRQAKP